MTPETQKILRIMKALPADCKMIAVGDVAYAFVPSQLAEHADVMAKTFKDHGYTVTVEKHEDAAPLRLHNVGDPHRVTKCVVNRGDLCVRVTSAPVSAEPVTKREGATEKPVETRKSMFGNLILGREARIEKAADVVEFEMRDGVLVRVDPEIVLDSPKPEDATREPVNPASHFPSGPGGNLVAAPPTPYSVTGAGTAAPHFLNFEPAGEPEYFTPNNFKAPSPGRNPADGAAPVDFTAPITRLGNGFLLKSEFPTEAE